MLSPKSNLQAASGTVYLIEKSVGRGGMATAYLARRPDGKEVLIKIPHNEFIASDQLIGRFVREMTITAKLDHPNIVKMWDQGMHQGIPFMVLEYLKSAQTVSEVIESGRSFREKEVVHILDKTCEALFYAHEQKCYHMDISENNLMVRLDRDGKNIEMVKVIDFGLGRMAEATRVTGQRSAHISATAIYEAPEYKDIKLREKKEHLCDQYSLGITAIKMLTGALPPDATSYRERLKWAKKRMSREKISSPVRNTILKMISEEPKDRFPTLKSASESLHALPKTPHWMSMIGLGLVIGAVMMASLSSAKDEVLSYLGAVVVFLILIINLFWDMSLSDSQADEKSLKGTRARQGICFVLMLLAGLVQMGLNVGQIRKDHQEKEKITYVEKKDPEKEKQAEFNSLMKESYSTLMKKDYGKARASLEKALKIRAGDEEAKNLLNQAEGNILLEEAKQAEKDGKLQTAYQKYSKAGSLISSKEIDDALQRLEKILGESAKSAKIVVIEPANTSRVNRNTIPFRGSVIGAKAESVEALGQKFSVLEDGSFSGELKLLKEGEIRIEVKGIRKDKEPVRMSVVMISADWTAPKVIILEPSPGFITKSDTIWVSGEIDDEKASVSVMGVPALLEGKKWKAQISLLQEGKKTITVQSEDLYGNRSKSEVEITIDRTAPRILVESPKEGEEITEEKIYLTGSVEDDLSSAKLYLSGRELSLKEGGRFEEKISIVEGSQEIELKAVDKAGNERVFQRKVIGNITAPTLTIESPQSGSTTKEEKIEVVCKFSKPVKAVWIEGLSAREEKGKWKREVELKVGKNEIKVNGRDQYGRTAVARVEVERIKETVVSQPVEKQPSSGGSSIAGFSYLGEKTYSCGGVTSTVKEYKHNATGMEFVLVPAGSFEMGSNDYNNEKPVHTVNVKSFLMAKTEVTQGVWKNVMGTTPWSGKSYVKEGDHYPATYVSYDMAKEFLKKFREKYSIELKLPSELQWEYACRAGTKTKYHWGDSDSDAGKYAWYQTNAWNAGEQYAHEVGKKDPNAYGLYDMAGNVWEWCEDYYHDSYNNAPTDGSSNNNSGSSFVVRGGGWYLGTRYLRSAVRSRGGRTFASFNVGFRCVMKSLD